MSAISFPNGHLPDHSQDDAPGFYSSVYDPAGSSFQMNPLSSHPPRTPRTSTINESGNSHVYGVQVYTSSEAPVDSGDNGPIHEVEVDEEDEKTKKRAARIRRETVWKEMLKTSVGRDKTLKVIQYGMKLFLLFHATVATTSLVRGSSKGTWIQKLVRRLDTVLGRLSLSRKCLILFDWISPLDSILARHTTLHSTGSSFLGGSSSKSKQAPKPLLHSFLHTPPPVLLELVQSIADDVSTASKLGLLGGKVGQRAGRYADWCLFISSLVNLVENAVERNITLSLQHEVESRLYDESTVGATGKSSPHRRHDERELQRLQVKDYWMKITRTKLLMDLIFVSYDVFHLKRGKRTVQTFSGLASGVLSFVKLYNTHKVKLLGSSSL